MTVQFASNRHAVIEQRCIEVFCTSGKDDDKLLGYAIWFSGSWDAWRLSPVGYRWMERIGSRQSREEAIALVLGDSP